jgi:hypothetical protein
MKEVLALIEKESVKFAQLTFFTFLEDRSIDPIKRLGFVPYFAPFVMGYKDLNKFVWLEEPTIDPIQAIVNKQIHEEENHWIWFLKDLEELNFDFSLSFTDHLKLIWSDETRFCRQTIYELYRYTYKVSPIYKLVVIESIESISNIFFSKTTPVVEELKLVTGREYPYFGNTHLLAENDHNIHSYEMEELITNIHLTEDAQKQACELVIKIFELFTVLVGVLVDLARKDRSVENVLVGCQRLFIK